MASPFSPAQSQIFPDAHINTSPRNELTQILNKYQEETLALLDSNPFLSTLIIGLAKTANKAPSDGYGGTMQNSSQDYENLRQQYEELKIEKDEVLKEHGGLEEDFIKLGELKDKLSKQCKDLGASLQETNNTLQLARKQMEDMKNEHQAAMTNLVEDHKKSEELARAEIFKLKDRCDFLLGEMTSRNGQGTSKTSQVAKTPYSDGVKSEFGKQSKHTPEPRPAVIEPVTEQGNDMNNASFDEGQSKAGASSTRRKAPAKQASALEMNGEKENLTGVEQQTIGVFWTNGRGNDDFEPEKQQDNTPVPRTGGEDWQTLDDVGETKAAENGKVNKDAGAPLYFGPPGKAWKGSGSKGKGAR